MSADAPPDWSREFDEPIPLPDGRELHTLADTGHYAKALPTAMQERPEWQTAAEMLILAAQDHWPVMFADIAMRKALHAGKTAPTPEPRRRPAKKNCRSLGACAHKRRRCLLFWPKLKSSS